MAVSSLGTFSAQIAVEGCAQRVAQRARQTSNYDCQQAERAGGDLGAEIARAARVECIRQRQRLRAQLALEAVETAVVPVAAPQIQAVHAACVMLHHAPEEQMIGA